MNLVKLELYNVIKGLYNNTIIYNTDKSGFVVDLHIKLSSINMKSDIKQGWLMDRPMIYLIAEYGGAKHVVFIDNKGYLKVTSKKDSGIKSKKEVDKRKQICYN